MRLHYTERFRKSYARAPLAVQRAFDKQATFLEVNLHHPSLRAEKPYKGHNLWKARINTDWRFYFTKEGDTYHLVDMFPHPK